MSAMLLIAVLCNVFWAWSWLWTSDEDDFEDGEEDGLEEAE